MSKQRRKYRGIVSYELLMQDMNAFNHIETIISNLNLEEKYANINTEWRNILCE